MNTVMLLKKGSAPWSYQIPAPSTSNACRVCHGVLERFHFQHFNDLLTSYRELMKLQPVIKAPFLFSHIIALNTSLGLNLDTSLWAEGKALSKMACTTLNSCWIPGRRLKWRKCSVAFSGFTLDFDKEWLASATRHTKTLRHRTKRRWKILCCGGFVVTVSSHISAWNTVENWL
jgi:hypothetical protein